MDSLANRSMRTQDVYVGTFPRFIKGHSYSSFFYSVQAGQYMVRQGSRGGGGRGFGKTHRNTS